MNELIAKIEQWSEDRNIIKGSKPIDQAMKLFSEFGELADNVGKGRDCRDDIGDVLVVLTIITRQLGCSLFDYASCEEIISKNSKYAVAEIAHEIADFVYIAHKYNDFANNRIGNIIGYLNAIATENKTTLEECVQIAYNDIKNRKGLMHQGIFIKESDPAYAEVLKSIEQNYEV